MPESLIELYAQTDIDMPSLKAVTVAQWMLESGRGSSDLATRHMNFSGLKWRADRMEGIDATPVQYEADDGVGTYTKFGSLGAFIEGYWAFVGRGPYGDPQDFKNNSRGYIQMLKDGGFASDPDYVDKVMRLLPEARELLEDGPPQGTYKLAVVVGHNHQSQGAHSKTLGSSEWPFNKQVAERMEGYAGEFNAELRVFFREPVGNVRKEIRTAYEKIDAWGADLSLELHFNGGPASASGSEMLYWHKSSKGRALAEEVQAAVLSTYGLRDRGPKPVQPGQAGAISVSAGVAPALVTEPFFGSNAGDASQIKAKGIDALAKTYLSGARDGALRLGLLKEGDGPPPPPPPSPSDEIVLSLTQATAEELHQKLTKALKGS